MSSKNRPFLRQKPILYFDENFPRQVVAAAKENRSMRNHFKIASVYDFSNQGKDDTTQLAFCRARDFVLVTLDRDFMDDKRYPIQKLPGIIYIAVAKNQPAKILSCLLQVTEFISFIPFPKSFMADSKFQVSREGCIMRARDATTREIKTIGIVPGDSVNKVLRAVGYVRR